MTDLSHYRGDLEAWLHGYVCGDPKACSWAEEGDPDVSCVDTQTGLADGLLQSSVLDQIVRDAQADVWAEVGRRMTSRKVG